MRSLQLLVPLLLACIAAAPRDVTVCKLPDGVELQVAADSQGVLHLIYFKGTDKAGDVYYLTSNDDAKTLSAAMRVNSEPNSATIIGAVRGPRLALDAQDRPHVIWTGSDASQPSPRLVGLPLLYSSLADDKKSFNKQREMIATGFGIDGGASIAIDRTDKIAITWQAPGKPNGDESDRRVWLVRSTNDGATFSPPRPIDTPAAGACACCATEAFFDADQHLNIIYRTARQLVHRDMTLLTLSDVTSPTKSTKLSEWQIGKCVMSTSAASQGVMAWESQDQILVARADSKNPTKLGQKNPKHPRIAVAGDRVLVAWTEETAWNKGGKLSWQLLDQNLKPIESQSGKTDALPVWDYPAITATKDGSFLIFY